MFTLRAEFFTFFSFYVHCDCKGAMVDPVTLVLAIKWACVLLLNKKSLGKLFSSWNLDKNLIHKFTLWVYSETCITYKLPWLSLKLLDWFWSQYIYCYFSGSITDERQFLSVGDQLGRDSVGKKESSGPSDSGGSRAGLLAMLTIAKKVKMNLLICRKVVFCLMAWEQCSDC